MPDAVLTAAADLARDAAIEAAEGAEAVGEHLGTVEEGDRLVTHTFECLLPGYRGWVWSVTLSRAPRGKDAAVAEVTLTPAADALLAPAWVPWEDRVQPGDLEPTMVLPLLEKDPRIVPAYEGSKDEDGLDEDALQIWELGLGRERVLGPEGREDVAARWYRGSHGPTAPSAIASTATCQECAFYVPLSGSLRLVFGVCTNEWSPSDGKVVSVDHGCGAHSQTDVERGPTQWPAADPVYASDSVVPFELGTTAEVVVEEAAIADLDAASDAESDAATAAGVDETPDDVEDTADAAPDAAGEDAPSIAAEVDPVAALVGDAGLPAADAVVEADGASDDGAEQAQEPQAD